MNATYFQRPQYLKFHFSTQKMKFSIKDFFSKCDQITQKTATSVTFTEKMLIGKLHVCAVYYRSVYEQVGS